MRSGLWRSTVPWLLGRPRSWGGRAVGRLLDRLNGIETSQKVELETLGLDAKRGHQYTPAGWFSLGRVLPKREVSPDDVFIDFGSGKGRILLAAARYPFKRVIGVELSPALTEIAMRNMANNVHRLACKEIALVTSDAAEYEVPDDATVVFLFNPFAGDTFIRVVENIRRSLDRRPRALRLVYVNPVMHEALAERGFRVVKKARGRVWLYRFP